MNLHVDHYRTEGSRAPLLLIHGWGMHGGMWRTVAEQLAQQFDVYAVDLPGHGYSVEINKPFGLSLSKPGQEAASQFDRLTANGRELTLDSVVDRLSEQFTDPLTVCGWSLGGQVALRWALRHPQQVKKLVMVASTPCFVRLDDWRYALSVEILEEFAVNLQQNYTQTLKRFLSLQMRGSEQEREVLAVLRDGLFSRGEPDIVALQAGLDILRTSDLRAALPTLQQPMLVIEGERDTMIPHQATQYLASHAPQGRLATIRGAAHAPFLSHRDEFVQHMMDFLNEKQA